VKKEVPVYVKKEVPARVKKEALVRVKIEAPVKTEVNDEPAPEEDERPWWVKEMMMADTACHPDESGLHLLQARSFNKAQPMDEATTLLWSAEESGVLIDLTKDDDTLPSVKKEE
jgi:hypothetical protein